MMWRFFALEVKHLRDEGGKCYASHSGSPAGTHGIGKVG
jgi:hypothetical protein